MYQGNNQAEKGVLRSLDYWTIIIYLALLTFGWVSVCGASYTYGETEIFSLSARSGMQIIWIGTSLMLALILLLLDDRLYETFAFVIFALLLVLLFATIFNTHSIKGSRSWLVIGPLRLQPAEFAKFATSLALAKYMGKYGFDIHNPKNFLITLAIFLIAGLGHGSEESLHIEQYTTGLANTFNISLWTLLVPLVTGVLIARKVPSLIVLFASSVMAGVSSMKDSHSRSSFSR